MGYLKMTDYYFHVKNKVIILRQTDVRKNSKLANIISTYTLYSFTGDVFS